MADKLSRSDARQSHYDRYVESIRNKGISPEAKMFFGTNGNAALHADDKAQIPALTSNRINITDLGGNPLGEPVQSTEPSRKLVPLSSDEIGRRLTAARAERRRILAKVDDHFSGPKAMNPEIINRMKKVFGPESGFHKNPEEDLVYDYDHDARNFSLSDWMPQFLTEEEAHLKQIGLAPEKISEVLETIMSGIQEEFGMDISKDPSGNWLTNPPMSPSGNSEPIENEEWDYGADAGMGGESIDPWEDERVLASKAEDVKGVVASISSLLKTAKISPEGKINRLAAESVSGMLSLLPISKEKRVWLQDRAASGIADENIYTRDLKLALKEGSSEEE